MDTIHKPPQLDETLQNKLHQLTKEFGIAHIFYHQVTSTAIAQIIIVAFENKYVEVIESRKWIRNSIENHGVIFHVISLHKIEFTYKKGNPFTAYYCHQNNLIYQNATNYKYNTANWKSFKKKFNTYEEEFHHDHDIFYSEISRFEKITGFTSMFLTYESLFTHNIQFLESLYLGKINFTDNLHQRIKHLARILPSIESLFVKENNTEYFLILQIEKGKTAAEHDDAIYVNNDLAKNIKDIEQKLYNMVCDRFSELKQLIKSGISLNNNELILNRPNEESELSKIISEITRIKPVEEIYLFDTKQSVKKSIYYLLLIGSGLGTVILNQIGQSIDNIFEGSCSVVLIGHSRIWIQKDIYVHQLFFKRIMTVENRVYQSHAFHPSIHWEDTYTPYYPDLDFAFTSAKKLSENYFLLRATIQNDNHQGLLDLFSTVVLRAFRTIIYAKLTYRTHFLGSKTMWQLCIHAEPELLNIEYLFEKLSPDDWFQLIDKHTSFHHQFRRISTEQLLVMDEILRILVNRLTSMVMSIDEKFVEWD